MMGNYAYVAEGAGGLEVISLANPASPQHVGGYRTVADALAVAVQDNYAYVTAGTAGLEVIDISNLVSLISMLGFMVQYAFMAISRLRPTPALDLRGWARLFRL